MIRVERGAAPSGFGERAKEWNAQFAAARAANAKLKASKFWTSVRKTIRADAEVLRERFRGKCAFCEAKMEHVSNPHIEHYRPKGRKEFEKIMFAWENWLLSCGRCNQKKWRHFPMCGDKPCLLDPTEPGNFDEHLEFRRATILGLSERGRVSIRLLGLARMPLQNERAQWLCWIDSLLLLAGRGDAHEVRLESRNLLVWAMQPDAPYAAMTTAHISAKAPKLANPKLPHPGIVWANQVDRIRKMVETHGREIAQIE